MREETRREWDQWPFEGDKRLSSGSGAAFYYARRVWVDGERSAKTRVNSSRQLRSRPAWLCLLLCSAFGAALASTSACANGKQCNRYDCDTGNTFHGPMDFLMKPGRSIFSRPCKCQSDWKSHFCRNFARYKLGNVAGAARMPSICICRQFSDAGSSCRQFMTQCYPGSKVNDECFCCFNQPGSYCNQLQCSNGQPEFGPKSNTTCVCHLPAFYPYYVCTREDLRDLPTDEVLPIDMRLNEGNSPKRRIEVTRSERKIKVLSVEITPGIAFAIVVLMLGAVIVLTGMLLVFRSCRNRRERDQQQLRRSNAQSALLQQRADEDKYLP